MKWKTVKEAFTLGRLAMYQSMEILDFALAIRTMVIKGNEAYIQAGAGIVYDSVQKRNMKKHFIN